MSYYAPPSSSFYFYIFDGLSHADIDGNVDNNWQKLYDRWSIPYFQDYLSAGLDDGDVLSYDEGTSAFVPWTPQLPEDMSGWEYNSLNLADQGSKNFITSTDGLTFTVSSSINESYNGCRCKFGKSSGKWYWEMRIISDYYIFCGVCTPTASLESYVGNTTSGWVWIDQYSAVRYNGGNYCNTPVSCGGSANDIMCFALDMDNRKFWAGKNGTWCGSSTADPSTGAGYCGPLLPESTEMFPVVGLYRYYPRSGTLNFGDGGFAYTPPAGFYPMKRPIVTTTTV